MRTMAEFWRRVSAAAKKHPLRAAASGIFAIICGYGAFSGGLHASYDDAISFVRLVTGTRKTEPPITNFNVQLVDVYAKRVNLDSSQAPPGVHKGLLLSASVRNYADPIYLQFDQDKASLGGMQQIPVPIPKRILPLEQGVSVTSEMSLVPVKSWDAEVDGRVDWTFKYGPNRRDLDRTVPVEGLITWELVAGKWRLTFVPDPDSAVPVGMAHGVAVAPHLLPE